MCVTSFDGQLGDNLGDVQVLEAMDDISSLGPQFRFR